LTTIGGHFSGECLREVPDKHFDFRQVLGGSGLEFIEFVPKLDQYAQSVVFGFDHLPSLAQYV